MEGDAEEKKEENTAKAVSAKRQKIADVCDAIKAQGGERPRISGRDAGAINASDAPPEEIARAWLRLSRGQWPPPEANESLHRFAQGNRVMWFAVDRLEAILAPPTTNGRAKRALDRYAE